MVTSLEQLSAQFEILQLVAKYGLYMDNGRFDEFEALFANDAVFSVSPDPKIIKVPVQGNAAIREQVEERHGFVSKTARHRHSTTNTLIFDFSGDQARGISQVTMTEILHAGGGPVLRGTGEYHDRYVRRGGVWLFAERTLMLDVLGGWRPGAGGDPNAGTTAH